MSRMKALYGGLCLEYGNPLVSVDLGFLCWVTSECGERLSLTAINIIR